MEMALNNASQVQMSAQLYPKLSKSDIFSVLQNDRRRCVLELLNSDGSQSLRTMSEAIACMESGTAEPMSSVRKSIYVSLLQTHLPKMESLGILTFDKFEDKVELMPAAADMKVYLETVEEGNIPWSHYYMGLSLFAILGSGAVSFELITWLTGMQWALFISFVFLASSIMHVRHMDKVVN
ncbi:MAG: hypothetical protein Q7J10_06740 [Methanosarcinaceae archaeon]|nr:hypothetical protein [Methanosarcinaceae archaeon]